MNEKIQWKHGAENGQHGIKENGNNAEKMAQNITNTYYLQ